MSPDAAEMLALQALAWLAGNDDLAPVFMGSTGVSLTDLRSRAADPELLVSVLDFLLMDDAWISAFCEANGLSPEVPMQARQALPGGDLPNWT